MLRAAHVGDVARLRRRKAFFALRKNLVNPVRTLWTLWTLWTL